VGAACWPDDVKAKGLEAMNDWHFVNKPYNVDGLLDIMDFSKGNALWAINETMYTLKYTYDPTSTDYSYEHSFALKYLIHIVGDMHQPLHVTEMFSDEFPSGDEGGNLFPITYEVEGQKFTELHALWDSVCGHLNNAPTRPLTTDGWNAVEGYAK
jgi:hypothetical protein